jgi:integrase
MTVKKTAKVRHLLDRDGRYYARIGVPAPLRPAIGKRELLEPLGADRKEALRKLPGAIARMQDSLSAARAESQIGRAPTRQVSDGVRLSPRQLALSHYADQTNFDDELRNTTPLYSHGFIDDEYVAALRSVIKGAASDQEIAKTAGWMIEKYRRNGHLEAEGGSPDWREAARALAAAELESLSRSAERDEGAFNGQPSHPILQEAPAPKPGDPIEARRLSPDSGKTLNELLPLFLAERKVKKSTDYEHSVSIRMFEECIGESKPIYRITRQDVQAYKRALADAPSNYTKRFPGLTLPDAIKANKERKAPFPVLNVKTINEKWLSKLHTFFGWCAKNDLIPDNPVAGVKVDAVKASTTPRNNFTPGELGRMFDSALFDSQPEEDRWAMWISLYSGLRASELGQMKLDSIYAVRGVLSFLVEERMKTTNSQRIVPVHSRLIELGLEERITKLRKTKETHLFPIWHRQADKAKREKASKGGPIMLNEFYPRFIPKRFNVTYRTKADVSPTRPWHSFRHTFKTALKLAGVPKPIRNELAGHADYSTGATYEHETSVESLKAAIEKLHFDGL